MARLRLRGVCAQPSRLPVAPNEPGRWFYSLFTKLRCDGGSSCGRRSAEGVVLLEGRVGATSSGPSRGRLWGALGLAAEPQCRAPTRPKAMVARSCRNGLRNHGDPSSGPMVLSLRSKSGAGFVARSCRSPGHSPLPTESRLGLLRWPAGYVLPGRLRLTPFGRFLETAESSSWR